MTDTSNLYEEPYPIPDSAGWYSMLPHKPFSPHCIPTTTIKEPEPVKHDQDTIAKREDHINKGGTRFETGAVRSADANHVMYQLISPIGLRRLAMAMKEGYDKYGRYNWEDGMPIDDLLNHALKHIFDYLENPNPSKRKEDDLAHAAWNLFAAMHMEETMPQMASGLRGASSIENA